MEMMTTKDDVDEITTVTIRVPTKNQIRQIVDLYRAQGWWQAGDAEIPHFVPRLIAGSHCFVVALKGEDIVGMGRAISDGISDAYIQDLTVCSGCRNQGVGRRILQILLERLHNDGVHWIGLIAEPGSDELYRRAGFREMSPWIPMLMTSKP
jgi:ribosomal protein S18 acetylase RimI-like enzyme